jgi:hypothetical protein
METDKSATNVCPKCAGQMDRGGLRGDKMSVWGHIKESRIFGVDVVEIVSPLYAVEAYRCEQCGFIELYATKQQGK